MERLRQAYPSVPIIARASEGEKYFHLMDAGATVALSDDREASLRLGSCLLSSLGLADEQVAGLGEVMRGELQLQDQEVLAEIAARRQQVTSANEKFDKLYKNIAQDGGTRLRLEDKELNTLRPVLTESAASLSARSINADAPPPSMNVFFEALNKLRDGFDSKDTRITSTPVVGVEMISASKAVETSSSSSSSSGSMSDSQVEKVDIDDDMLGVTVCILPPKKSSASSSKVMSSED